MSHIDIKSGDHKWKMHEILLHNLKGIKKESLNDWDFKILISGDGMTRSGKSTIAFQIAQALDQTFANDWENRILFDSEKLIENARKVGKNKALVYDEARAGLDSKRQMFKYSRNLLDFLSECGSLNHFIIIVLPEFFDLQKSIAINSSVFLINVIVKKGHTRGYFDFYNRKDKRYLFIKGKAFLNYHAQNRSWGGTFTKYIPLDRKKYEKIKQEELQRIREREEKPKSTKRLDKLKGRNMLLIEELKKSGYTQKKIARVLGVTEQRISQSQNLNIKS